MAGKPPSDLDSFWIRGASTATDNRMPAGHYVRSWNVANRGGVLRTRPGSRFLFNLPSSKIQALASFDPVSGPPLLVLVADGYVYTSEYPFRRLRRLPGLRMDADAPRVWVQEATQFIERNADSSLTLITPKRVLIFQDGRGSPGYFDGYNAGKLDQTDDTPLGTAMAWSGNRLWVARRDRVFASDYGNPFSFVEQFYLGGSDSLLMPESVIGMSEVPGSDSGRSVLLIFGRNKTVAVRSGVLNREQWTLTEDFQQTIFPEVGCVSDRSITTQYGFLWWYSKSGLVSLDLAQQANVTSAFRSADNEMLHFKAHLTPSIDQIAATSFENLLLVSVPVGGRLNRHTWVLDSSVVQTLTDAAPMAWSGAWTGFEPVEWTKLTIMGAERLYVATVDTEGNSQLLECFSGNRTDSGQDIECAVELRAMTGGISTLKGFKFADLTFTDVYGTVDFRCDWRGFNRGPWKKCLDYRAKVGRGSFHFDRPIEEDTVIQAFLGQMRRVQTQEVSASGEVPLSTCHTEVNLSERWDWAFSFLVRWNGSASLREFSPVFDDRTERVAGRCVADDEEDTFTRYDGSSAETRDALEASPVTIYEGTESSTGSWVDGTEVSATKSAFSLISQRAADKMAQQAAEAQVAYTLAVTAEPVVSEGGE